MSSKPLLTCLIPLYQSKQFRSIVLKNIQQHINMGIAVKISDRHMRDNLADEIEEKYQGNPLVQVLKVSTPYFRILPHDDSAKGSSSQLLVDALEKDGAAIVATGIVKAENLYGIPIFKRYELNKQERKDKATAWDVSDSLAFFWQGRFAGSFKGVIRTSAIKDHRLLIKKTPTLIYSERTWLFALSLLGKFILVPESVLIKRYYSGSTHRKWVYSERTTMDAARVMSAYCDQLVVEPKQRQQVKFNLYYNALNRIRPRSQTASFDAMIPSI